MSSSALHEEYSIRMGRTIPAWRMVVNAEMERMKKFADFLRPEDKVVFEDMMNQCKIYASYASTMASPVKEVPLMMSILFAQHKMLWKHEKQLSGAESQEGPASHPQQSILKESAVRSTENSPPNGD